MVNGVEAEVGRGSRAELIGRSGYLRAAVQLQAMHLPDASVYGAPQSLRPLRAERLDDLLHSFPPQQPPANMAEQGWG